MSFDIEKEGQNVEKGHKPEQIVAKLRQVDVLVSRGHAVADAVRSIGGFRILAHERQSERRCLVVEPFIRLSA
jgi:hypothetical protein